MLVASLAFPGTGRAGGILPPSNPPANYPAPAGYGIACYGESVTVSGCNQASLQAIDGARRAEGLGPMILPTNFASLNGAEQILVMVNLERVDRGLPPMTGLAPSLDDMAQAGAQNQRDPVGPSNYSWQSLWAGGEPTPLAADFDWMYEDGIGSSNVACPPSCWSHRDDILGAGGELGAGVYGRSYGVLFVQGYNQTPTFSWTSEIRYLRAAVASISLLVSSSPGATNVAQAVIFASGANMPVTASFSGSGPWSLLRTGCTAHPGGWCTIPVAFRPVAPGVYHASLILHAPNLGMTSPITGRSGHGYWQTSSAGQVFDFGWGGYYGSLGVALRAPVVAMSSTPNHGGYWLVGSDGGVFGFGNAHYFGSTGGIPLNAPVVGAAATHDGRGYWLVASDGGVFSFGDARFYGSTGGRRLNAPIVGMAASADGRGYWLVASDGGVFTFGDARFHGSTGGIALAAPIRTMVADGGTGGYWLFASDGGVFAFQAPFLGSTANARVPGSVVGGAAS